MHNFFLHKNILIFRRFFNSANRFYLYYTKNDVKTKLSDKIIYITWDVIPVIYDAEKKTILNVQRLL